MKKKKEKKEKRIRKDFDPNDVKLYFKGILPPDLEEIRKSGKKFTDPYFPPEDRSIDSLTETGEFVDKEEGPANKEEMDECFGYKPENRQWARPEEVDNRGEWKIFQDGATLDDIVQGNIGDCYFISSAAALVEFPELLQQNFPTQNYADIGYYEVVLYIDGEWQRVFLDNYFPVRKNYKNKKGYQKDKNWAFYFSKPNGRELWAILLEKAWAKVNGGYSNTSGGNQFEVLLAFTGFPSEILFNNTDNALKIFEKIEKADKNDAVMGCASYPGQDVDENELGISYGHAYTLIDAKSKGEDVGAIYLYKIRNPWGEGEWKGDWCDKDTRWNEKEVAEYFDFKKGEDGVFHVDADSYPENFQNTQICRILYNAKMKNYLINKEEFFKGAMVYNLFMPDKGDVIFSVIERSRRFNRDLPYEKYAFFSLLIFKYDENYVISKFIGGKSNTVPCGINETLDKGYYACVIYFPYEYEELGPNFNYTFTIYSPVNFKSKFAGKDPKLQCLENLIIGYFRNTKDYELGTSNKYICTDIKEIMKTTNLTPRIFFNNLGQKIQFTINYTNKKGVVQVGTFDEKYWKKPIELVLNKGKFGLFLLATKESSRSYKPSCGISYGKAIEAKEDMDFDNYRFDNLLTFDFKDDKDLVTPNKKPDKENIVETKDTANNKPTLEETKPQEDTNNNNKQASTEAPKEEEPFSNPMNSICTYDNLKKEYPNEFQVLENYLKEKQDQSKFKWIKIQNPNGIYVGQMNDKNQIEGRGIFFYNNGQEYVGRFKDGNMNEYGYFFGPQKNLLYKGEVKNGAPNGSGLLYNKENNYYVGNFVDGILQGYGTSIDEKGNEWVGNFVDNKEDGVGLMKTTNPKAFYLYKYNKGVPEGQSFQLNDEEATVLKQKRDKVINLQEQYSLGNSSLKDVTSFQDTVLKGFNTIYKYKVKNGPDAVHKACKLEQRKDIDPKKEEMYEQRRSDEQQEQQGKETKEDAVLNDKEEKEKKKQEKKEQEANKLQKTSLDLTFNETMKFLAWQIIDMNPFYQISDIKVEPVNTNKEGVYSLYAEKLPDFENGYKAIGDGENYYIGEFKDNKPNGLVRKFGPNKQILMEGQMHTPYVFDNGEAEKWYPNGNHYKGPIQNEMAEGIGEITFNNGDKWMGPFTQDYKNGKGKYLTKFGYNQLNVTYDKNTVTSQEFVKKMDKFYKPFVGTLGFLKDDEKSTLFSYLNEVPPVLTLSNIRWVVLQGNSNKNYYVGQVNEKNKKEGRGIICNTGEDSQHFYVGQFKDGRKEGYGLVLNQNYEIEYEGDYKNDAPNGYGNLFLNTYSYHGGFKNGKMHGFGARVPHETNNQVTLIEGIYKNGREFKVSKIDLMARTSQKLEYDDEGNLSKFSDLIENNGPDFKRQVETSNNTLKVNFKALKHVKEFQTLLPIAPKFLFMTTYRYCKDGLYIGEIDQLGMRCGRGKLINLFDNSYYLGNWFNNIREGEGTLFKADGSKIYEGTFLFDKPLEKGIYYLQDRAIKGNFDPLGSGVAEILDPKNNYEKKGEGNFYALQQYDSSVLQFLPKIGESTK